jgi:predicted NBD/HSP70 family sugar kinase
MRGGFVAAVDLGASNVRVAIANTDGEIEARRHFPTPGGSPADTLEKISRTVDDLVRGVWIGARIDALGIVLPGMVDPDKGVAASVANMQGWDDVPLAAILGRGADGKQSRVVAMENDANAAAIGEGWIGAARGLKHYVFIALGTGIGGGVVIDGRLHRGGHFLGGELAYFSMTREQVRAGGWANNLEAIVGGRAIADRARAMLGDQARPADLFDAAAAGQAEPAAWLAEVQETLAMSVVDICALLDPEMVVFGGGVIAAQSAQLVDHVRELVHRNTPVPTKITTSELGEDAQLVGAVRLALEKEGIVKT